MFLSPWRWIVCERIYHQIQQLFQLNILVNLGKAIATVFFSKSDVQWDDKKTHCHNASELTYLSRQRIHIQKPSNGNGVIMATDTGIIVVKSACGYKQKLMWNKSINRNLFLVVSHLAQCKAQYENSNSGILDASLDCNGQSILCILSEHLGN